MRVLAVTALFSLVSAVFATPVAADAFVVTKGGPAGKSGKSALVAALSSKGSAVRVCFATRRAKGPVSVSLRVARSGEVTAAKALGGGVVGQCVAGVLAVQRLSPTRAAYRATVRVSPPGSGASSVRAQLRTLSPTLNGCYDNARKSNAKLAGKLTLGFVITADGRVIDPRVITSTMNSRTVNACLVAALKRARFSPPADGKAISYKLPLVFDGSSSGTSRVTASAGRLRPQKDGPVSTGEITAVMNKRKAEFSRCYDREAKRNRKLAGAVTIRFTIRERGNVTNVKVRNTTLKNAVVEACLVKVGKTLKFSAKAGRAPTRVFYPFQFSAK